MELKAQINLTVDKAKEIHEMNKDELAQKVAQKKAKM